MRHDCKHTCATVHVQLSVLGFRYMLRNCIPTTAGTAVPTAATRAQRVLGSGPGAAGACRPLRTGPPHLWHGSGARRRPFERVHFFRRVTGRGFALWRAPRAVRGARRAVGREAPNQSDAATSGMLAIDEVYRLINSIQPFKHNTSMYASMGQAATREHAHTCPPLDRT